MFKRPFSFNGRIRRREYAISFTVCMMFLFVVNFFTLKPGSNPFISLMLPLVFLVLLVLSTWLLYAQGAKRCHDTGKSGWWQIIPFFFLVLLFQDGDADPNEYGENPKSDPADDIIDSIGKN